MESQARDSWHCLQKNDNLRDTTIRLSYFLLIISGSLDKWEKAAEVREALEKYHLEGQSHVAGGQASQSKTVENTQDWWDAWLFDFEKLLPYQISAGPLIESMAIDTLWQNAPLLALLAEGATQQFLYKEGRGFPRDFLKFYKKN